MLQPPPTRANRDIVTPEPIYDPTCTTCTAPGRIPIAEHNRARQAMAKARQLYPGPVGELIARELQAYTELGWLAGQHTIVARVITHILELSPELPDNAA